MQSFLKWVSSVSHLIHQRHQLCTFLFPSLTRKCFSRLVHVTQDPDSQVAFGWWVLNLLVYGFSLCLFRLFLGVYLVRKSALWSCRVSHINVLCWVHHVLSSPSCLVSRCFDQEDSDGQPGPSCPPPASGLRGPGEALIFAQIHSVTRGQMAQFWFCPSSHSLHFFFPKDFSFFDCMIILGQCSLDVWFFPSYLPVFRIIISF